MLDLEKYIEEQENSEAGQLVKQYEEAYNIVDEFRYSVNRYNSGFKRFIRKKEFEEYKNIRMQWVERLILLRDLIVEYESKYNARMGESPMFSFTNVVQGGYGSKLFNTSGHSFLNIEGYFPMIVCHPSTTEGLFSNE